MELYQLRTFVAVAREGNLSRAAEKLFTSQPAASAQIKSLEQALGVALFKRTPKGMELTGHGRVLLDDAVQALAAASSVEQRARAMRGTLEGPLHLGTVSQPVALRLGSFLSTLAASHPGIDIRIRQGVSGAIAQGVEAGDLDAGYVIGDVGGDLLVESVAPVTLVVALPRGAARADAPWDQIAALPWLGTPDDCSFTALAADLFAHQGSVPRRVLEADQESALGALVAAGVGASLLRMDQAVALQADGGCTLWENARIDTTLSLVLRRDRAEDPMLRAVREVAASTWRS